MVQGCISIVKLCMYFTILNSNTLKFQFDYSASAQLSSFQNKNIHNHLPQQGH